MDLFALDRKQIGALGERLAAHYLHKHGFVILDRNVVRKMGEVDLIARKDRTMHFVEVKTMTCDELPPYDAEWTDAYDPSVNLHETKIRKVARMGEWYMAEHELDDEWQVDGVLVWLRRHDGKAYVRYLPQLV